jgi:hypothetical protein
LKNKWANVRDIAERLRDGRDRDPDDYVTAGRAILELLALTKKVAAIMDRVPHLRVVTLRIGNRPPHRSIQEWIPSAARQHDTAECHRIGGRCAFEVTA